MADKFDLNPDAPVDVAILHDATLGVKALTTNLLAKHQAESKVLQESMAEGGPGGTVEAIRNIMTIQGMGMRELSKLSGIRRHTLKQMLEDQLEMSMQDSLAIIDVLQVKFPNLTW